MRKLCVFLGLAAIGYKLNVGATVALLFLFKFGESNIPQYLTIAVGLAIAAWFVWGDRLAERLASAQWIVVGFGAVGAIIFLLGKPIELYSSWMVYRLGYFGTSVVSSVLDAVLLLCFLKLAADLASPGEIALPAQDEAET